MAALKLLFVLAFAGAGAPAKADAVSRWSHHMEEASARFGVPTAWIERVMRAESRGRTTWNGRPIVSHAGAMGLMQLMPGTWTDMRARLGLGDDPHVPRDNIMAGTLYLRLMYDRFGYPGLFAAYNAGPARYAQHLAAGTPLPAETRAYLKEVSGAVGTARERRAPAAEAQRIFFMHSVAAAPSLSAPVTGLFVALRATASAPESE